MRAWLFVCAALALAPCRATAAHAHPDTERLERIKSQILAKLGLTTRPTPQGAPPHDVVRQILARAADPAPREEHHDEHAMREIIAIAHRDINRLHRSVYYEKCFQSTRVTTNLTSSAPLLLPIALLLG